MKDDLAILHETERCAPNAKRVRFFAGIILIAVSFLVYPAYPIIMLLPFSGQVKAAVMVAASLLSWGIFGAGFLLAGREGYDWLKGVCKRPGR